MCQEKENRQSSQMLNDLVSHSSIDGTRVLLKGNRRSILALSLSKGSVVLMV